MHTIYFFFCPACHVPGSVVFRTNFRKKIRTFLILHKIILSLWLSLKIKQKFRRYLFFRMIISASWITIKLLAKHIAEICSLLGHICTFHSETSGPVHIKATLLVYMLSKYVCQSLHFNIRTNLLQKQILFQICSFIFLI